MMSMVRARQPAARQAVRRHVRCMGALTSKPYAFNARPWELRDTLSVDTLDGMGSSIKLQSKGSEILRVVPRENDEINEEWITDKSRFSYDGLKRQRLTRPLVRSVASPGQWDETGSTWRGAFARMKTAFDKQKESGGAVRAVCGPTVDLYGALALSDWSTRFADVELEGVGSKGGSLGADLMSQYRFNSTIRGLEAADVVVIVGSDLEGEAPLLMTRMRKAFLQSSMDVYSIGMPTNMTFPTAQAGLKAGTLVDVAEGKHPLTEVLKNAERPAIVVSSQVYNRQDGAALAGVVEKLAVTVPGLRQHDKKTGELVWNGVNTLHHNANDVGLLDLGRVKPFDTAAGPPDILYLLGLSAYDLPCPVDDLIGPNTFTVYQGHHGDELAARADVVLAGAAWPEKDGFYINFEGRAQLSRNAITPPVDARVDWKIVRAMAEATCDMTLPYSSDHEVRARLASLVPTVDARDKVSPAMLPTQLVGDGYTKLATKSAAEKVDNTPFRPALHDFWLDGNVIARSSQVMAKCSKELTAKTNFVEMPF